MSLSINNSYFYTRPQYTHTQRTPTRARAHTHYAHKARACACTQTKHTDPVNYMSILSSATCGILVHEQPCSIIIHEQSLRYTHPHLYTHNTHNYARALTHIVLTKHAHVHTPTIHSNPDNYIDILYRATCGLAWATRIYVCVYMYMHTPTHTTPHTPCTSDLLFQTSSNAAPVSHDCCTGPGRSLWTWLPRAVLGTSRIRTSPALHDSPCSRWPRVSRPQSSEWGVSARPPVLLEWQHFSSWCSSSCAFFSLLAFCMCVCVWLVDSWLFTASVVLHIPGSYLLSTRFFFHFKLYPASRCKAYTRQPLYRVRLVIPEFFSISNYISSTRLPYCWYLYLRCLIMILK